VIVLAIYNLKGNEALLARELATVLGKTVYEASSRVRAPGGGPSVIASFATARAAQETTTILQERGFDTLLLDDAAIETDARRFVVRDFAFAVPAGGDSRDGGAGDAGGMQVAARDGSRLDVRYADIDLILRGV
jgi:hypothetical protein